MSKLKTFEVKRKDLGSYSDKTTIKSPKQSSKQDFVSPRTAIKNALKPLQPGSSTVSTFLNLSSKKPSLSLNTHFLLSKEKNSPRSTAKPLFKPGLSVKVSTANITPLKPRPQSPFVRTSSKKQPQSHPPQAAPVEKAGGHASKKRQPSADIDPLACLDKLIHQTVNGGGYFDEPEEKSLLKTQDEDHMLQENQVLLPPLRRKGTRP